MKFNGEVLRFNDGWALAEFYPESLRNRLSQQSAPKRKARKKPKKRGKQTAVEGVLALPASTSSGQDSEAFVERLEAFARSRRGEPFSYQDAARAVPGPPPKVVALTLGRLAKKFGWEKDEGGMYRVV
jgi:hypothetical protein